MDRVDPARARSALAAASLAACIVGLLGVDGGVIWVVAGVWTLRSLVGTEPDVAWGIACAGAAMRWGTLSIGDVQVATRILGAPLLTGPILVRLGLGLAFLAALCSEASREGLRDRSIVAQATAGVALVSLIPLYLVPGGTNLEAPEWVVAAACLTAVAVLGGRFTRLVPSYAPPLAAALGVSVAMIAR